MDMVKIGQFLSELRREADLTQAQLGEKLGVTNKTVSRWETGSYLPPVEMLQMLGKLYGVSINEILSGKRLSDDAWKEKAEENIKSALSQSAFSLKERVEYFRKKWKKDHRLEWSLEAAVLFAAMVCGFVFFNGLQYVVFAAAVVWYFVQYNRMMAYVENHAYGTEEKTEKEA